MSRPVLRTFRVVAVTLVVIASLPTIAALTDETLARSRFPLLFSAGNLLELSRWQGNANRNIRVIGANNWLELSLDPRHQYPGAELVYFPGDWLDYNRITFDVLNPDKTPIRLTVSIIDRQHEMRGFYYSDRFSQIFTIQPGRQTLSINLADIRDAPRDRKMELSHITGIRLFTSRQESPRLVYVGKIQLVE